MNNNKSLAYIVLGNGVIFMCVNIKGTLKKELVYLDRIEKSCML